MCSEKMKSRCIFIVPGANSIRCKAKGGGCQEQKALQCFGAAATNGSSSALITLRRPSGLAVGNVSYSRGLMMEFQ
jgi:hypothetical protein